MGPKNCQNNSKIHPQGCHQGDQKQHLGVDNDSEIARPITIITRYFMKSEKNPKCLVNMADLSPTQYVSNRFSGPKATRWSKRDTVTWSGRRGVAIWWLDPGHFRFPTKKIPASSRPPFGQFAASERVVLLNPVDVITKPYLREFWWAPVRTRINARRIGWSNRETLENSEWKDMARPNGHNRACKWPYVIYGIRCFCSNAWWFYCIR